MKSMIVISIIFLLSGCERTHSGYIRVIQPENKAKAAKWILDCIEKGNPHSDEEPEDAANECSSLAHGLFGDCVFVKDDRWAGQRGGNWCSQEKRNE